MRALAIAVLVALTSAAGCGFELRSAASLPFETIYIPAASAGIGLELKRNIAAGTHTRVSDDARGAVAVLHFTQETREKEILSLTGGGRVREFRLRYRVSFHVNDARGGAIVPGNTIELARDMTYDDALALAKEAEEQFLYRDMQSDMAQRILRRLSAAKPSPG